MAAPPDFRLRPTIAGLALVAMAATTPALHAQTSWSGSVTGPRGGGADLTIGDAPGSTGWLSARGTEFYTGQLQVGVSGEGGLNASEGTYFRISNTSVIGVNPDGVGIVTSEGQNTWLSLDDSMYVGQAGSGTVVVTYGGRLTLDRTPSGEPDLNIGVQAGASGSVTVIGRTAGGVASILSVDGGVRVGMAGKGRLEMSDGAKASVASSVTVGAETGGDGTLVVDLASSTLDAATTIVGDAGTGRATVSNGGALTTGAMTIGSRAGGKGEVTASDVASRLSIAGNLLVGESGTGRLSVLAGGGAVAGNVTIGQNRGSTGTVLVDGQGTEPSSSSTLKSNLSIFVGDAGDGAMTVSNGGQAIAQSNVIVANEAASGGTLSVAGAGSALVATRRLHVGLRGTGSMRVADGAQASVGLDATFGTDAGADGTLVVTGAGSALRVQGTTHIGDSGTGKATVSSGGALATGTLSVGDAGIGNATVDGAGSTLSVSGAMVVGGAGAGGLSVVDGATAEAQRLTVGRDAGASGLVKVAGTRSRLTLDTLTVADAGTGTVEVSGGGGVGVTSTEASTVIGERAGVQGVVRVAGAGSTFDVARDLAVGRSGTGALTVADGARAAVGTSLAVGRDAGSTGTVTVAGAGSLLEVRETLQVGVKGNASLGVAGGGQATVGATAVVGAEAGSVAAVSVAGAGSRLGVAGELVVGKAAPGRLGLSGGAAVQAGSLRIGLESGVGGDATVAGTGSSLAVADGLEIGASGRGTLSVSGGARASAGTDVHAGANAGSDGVLSVTGPASALVAGGTTFVGSAGTGTATVSDAATLATGALSVGHASGAQGRMTVDGAGSALDVAGALQVGRSGGGTLTLSNGARATSAITLLGQNAGGIATVRLAGAGSSLATGDVHLGRNDRSDASVTSGGIAGLTVADGATLHAASGLRYDAAAPGTGPSPTSTGTVYVAVDAGSTAMLNVGADAGSAATAAGTIDARSIVFGRGKGFLVLNHTAQDLVFTPAIEGTGRVQALSGTTTLAAVNTYSGGTSIAGATLKGTATGFGSGAIQNDGALVIEQAADAPFANVVTGAGTLTKTGAGTLEVTGDSSGFTGATAIAAGRLAVNGSLARSVVTAQAGTTLSGAGTVGGVNARAGATVAPGNSPGTLTVAGDYRQAAGSTYAAEVVPGGTVSDLIAVGGTATLDSGAVIRVSKYGAGGYAPGTRYTVLSAEGGVDGTYALTGETDVSAFYALRTAYDARHVYLDTVQVRPFAAAAGTPNQAAAANGVQGLAPARSLPLAIGSLRRDEEARRAFDQVSGELHASARTVLVEDSRFVREATTRQVHASGDGTGEPVWAHGYGSSGRHGGDGNAAGLARDIGGLFVGTDAAVGGGTRLGIVGGYGRSRIDLKEGRGSATVDTYGLGLYGATQWDRTRLGFGANQAWHRLSTNRAVGLEGFADRLSADHRARTTQFYGDVGYRMGADLDLAPAALEPFAALAWVDLRTPGVQEKGGAAALEVAGGSTRAGFATLGLRSAATLDIGGVPVAASGLLGWRSVLGGRTPSSANGFAGAAGFVVQGVPLARDVAAVEANLSAALTRTLTLGLAYAGQIGPGFSDHGIRASLSMKF